MNYKKKLENLCCLSLSIITSLILIYIFFISLFKSHETFSVYSQAYEFKAIILFLGMIIMIGLLMRFSRFIEKTTTKKAIYVIILMGILLLVLQILYLCNFKYINHIDLATVHGEAIALLNNGSLQSSTYLSTYPNNIPITIFLAGIYNLAGMLGITCYKNVGIAVNMISIDLCMIFLCLLVKRKYGIKKCAMIFGLILINPIVYVYLPTYYTNSLSLVFYTFLLFVYDCFSKNKKIQYLILLGVISMLGIKLRITVGIMLIAVMLSMIIKFKLKDFMKYISVIIACVIITGGVYRLVENKYIKFDYSETRYPPTHWLMMGSKDSSAFGGYNSNDAKFTSSFKSYDEKKKATTSELLNRLKKNGISGNIKRLNKKYIRLFSIGTYGFTQHIQNVEKFTIMYKYILGDKSIFFNYYLQIMHLTLLFLSIVMCIRSYSIHKFDLNKTCMLFIFGTFLFYTFWEADPRYSMMLVPALLFLCTNGIEIVSNGIKLNNKLNEIILINSDGNIAISKESIARFFAITKHYILLIIILIVMFSYGKYTSDLHTSYNWSVNNYRTNRIETIKNNDIVKQTFVTDKSFNTVELYVEKKDLEKDNIQIRITDNSNKKEIYNEVIKLSEFDDNGAFKVRLDKVKPSTTTKYTIEINPVNISEDIKIMKFYKPYINTVPDGSMMINGDMREGNIQFKVYNEYKAPFMSVRKYYLFSIIIIFISFFSLYGQRYIVKD